MKGRKLTDEELLQMVGKKVLVEFKTIKLLPNGIYILKYIENKQPYTFITEDFRCSFDFDTCLGRDAIYYEYIEEPKTYKTSEMIAMLEENPKLKFKCVNTDSFFEVFVMNKKIIIRKENGKTDNGFCTIDRWQLIEEPKEVTFLEAVKAYNEGKKIRSVSGNNEFTYERKLSVGMVSMTEILNAKWFIL